MNILPVSQRITFEYRGKCYTSFGRIDRNEITKDRILYSENGGNIPSQYSQCLFAAKFPDGESPYVFLHDGRPVIFLFGWIYSYRPALPIPPPGLNQMQTVCTEYSGNSIGVEYFIRLQSNDTPPQEWCSYEYTVPLGAVFTAVAPTVEDCRMFRDLWLTELTAGKQ